MSDPTKTLIENRWSRSPIGTSRNFTQSKKMKQIKTNINRIDLVRLIKREGRAIELGVFKGHYSQIILENSNCFPSYSVDRWAGDRGHDQSEEQEARNRLSKYGERSIVEKLTFKQALKVCRETGLTFDFIYLDGYAHEGQGDLSHFAEWFTLLNDGGIFAGHDYDQAFPKNVKNIDSFFQVFELPFFLTNEKTYPSFYTFKR